MKAATRVKPSATDERRLLSSVARFTAGGNDARGYRLPTMATMRRCVSRFRDRIIALDEALGNPYAPGSARVLEECAGAWLDPNYGAAPTLTDLLSHVWSIGHALRGGCMDEKMLRSSRTRARKTKDEAGYGPPKLVRTAIVAASISLGESSVPKPAVRTTAALMAVATLRPHVKARRTL